nr:hypothetical protein [Escherichia coli]
VSIKNDGHYFCRAGGNRPDGLNEPVTFATDITIQLTLIFLLIAIVIAPLIAPFVTGYVNANYHPCGNNTGIFPGAIYIKNGMKCNNEYISRKEDSAVK